MAMSEMRIRRHLFASGRVQGVYFRESLRREAERHAVTGWTRNLPDGRLEAVVEGDRSGVEAVVDWCRRGPEHADVSDLVALDEAPQGETDFHIRR